MLWNGWKVTEPVSNRQAGDGVWERQGTEARLHGHHREVRRLC